MNTIEEIQGIKMVTIPAGRFMMGHVYDPDARIPASINVYYPDEQPIHQVSLPSFQLGMTQVTQEQYEKVMGQNSSSFTGDSFLPVTNLGPAEIKEFCNRMSKAAGLEQCYDEKTRACGASKNGFRMPTEEEWEYSCRAGTTTMFSTGNTERDLDRAGWYRTNSGGRTHPVARKEPNAWGLYDMHGNVFEFCEDDWNPNLSYGRYLDKRAPKPTYHYYHTLNVTRGGSWFSEPAECRSALRACFCSWDKIFQSYYMGFRVVRSST